MEKTSEKEKTGVGKAGIIHKGPSLVTDFRILCMRKHTGKLKKNYLPRNCLQKYLEGTDKIQEYLSAYRGRRMARNHKIRKKHATYVKYRTVYEKYIQDKIGKVLLSELNPEILTDVFQRKDQMKLSNSLRNSISCVLNQILNYAVLYYQFNTIQYSCPKYRRENKMTEILSSDEQKRLFQYLYNEMDIYKLGIIICISTGLRLGEICSLKWGDINLEEKIMCVNTTVQRIPVEGEVTKTVLLEGKPKSTCSKREIPLSDELTELIYVYYTNAGEYVINKNTPWNQEPTRINFRDISGLRE